MSTGKPTFIDTITLYENKDLYPDDGESIILPTNDQIKSTFTSFLFDDNTDVKINKNNNNDSLFSPNKKLFHVFTFFTKCENIESIINQFLRDFDPNKVEPPRKNSPEILKKKIKSKFLKAVFCTVNNRIHTKHKFVYAPKKFNNGNKEDFVSKSKMTLESLLKQTSKNYNIVLKEIKNKKEMYSFNIIKNMKYKEIFKEYLGSMEFLKDIWNLNIREISLLSDNTDILKLSKEDIKEINTETFLKDIDDLYSNTFLDISKPEIFNNHVKNFVKLSKELFM